MELTRFETDVLTAIYAAEAPELLVDISQLEAQSREHTGVGVFVNMLPSKKKTGGKTFKLGKTFLAEVDGIQNGVGALLYVEEGTLTTIEMYCFGAGASPRDSFELYNKYGLD